MNRRAADAWIRVKMCGITTVDCAKAVEEAGANALGLVFYPHSARCVSVSRAKEIVGAVCPLMSVVALFVDPEYELVKDVLNKVGVNLLQFHGNESPNFCEQFDVPYIKAVRLEHENSVHQATTEHARARGFLLDAFVPGMPGGTGVLANWSRIPRDCERPLILAGGLNPENVAEAIATTGVRSVDVSSGIESEPGKKSVDKIRAFMKGVRSA